MSFSTCFFPCHPPCEVYQLIPHSHYRDFLLSFMMYCFHQSLLTKNCRFLLFSFLINDEKNNALLPPTPPNEEKKKNVMENMLLHTSNFSAGLSYDLRLLKFQCMVIYHLRINWQTGSSQFHSIQQFHKDSW